MSKLDFDRINLINHNHPLNRSLIWWWLVLPYLQPSRSYLFDISLSGNRASLENMDAATDWIVGDGPSNLGALDFDGTNDRASFTPTGLPDLSEGTIIAWVKPRTVSQYRGIISPRSNDITGGRPGLLVNQAGNAWAYIWDGDGPKEYQANTGLFAILNEWQLVAASVTPNGGVVYQWAESIGLRKHIDSTLKDTRPINREWLIGNDANQSLRYFDGRMSDIRVHSTSFSEDEIVEYAHLSSNGYQDLLNRKRQLVPVEIFIDPTTGSTISVNLTTVYENTLELTVNQLLNLEWRLSVGNDGDVLSLEWMSEVSRSCVKSIEFIQGIAKQSTTNLENIGVIQKNSILPYSFTLQLTKDDTVNTDSVLDVLRNSTITTEYLTRLSKDSVLNIEWRGATIITANRLIDLEWLSELSLEQTLNQEQRLELSKSDIINLENNFLLSTNLQQVIENLGGVSSVNVIQIQNKLDLSEGRSINTDHRLSISISRQILISWLTEITNTYSSALTWLQGLEKNNIIPIAWGGAPVVPDQIWVLDSRDRIWTLNIRDRTWILTDRNKSWPLDPDGRS